MTEEEFQERLRIAQFLEAQEEEEEYQAGAHENRWANFLNKFAQEQQQANVSVPQLLSPDVIELTIDADGDQKHNELKLYLNLAGNTVNIRASNIREKEPEIHEIGNITIKRPELFHIWHQVPSNGKDPYLLFLSLTAYARAFMDVYEELPDDIRQVLIDDIKKKPLRGLL